MPAAITIARHRPARPFGILSRVRTAMTLYRQRARLAALDDHLLRDVGLTRDEALAEATRPLWDVPSHWRG